MTLIHTYFREKDRGSGRPITSCAANFVHTLKKKDIHFTEIDINGIIITDKINPALRSFAVHTSGRLLREDTVEKKDLTYALNIHHQRVKIKQ